MNAKKIILFNKPFRCLSQFTDVRDNEEARDTLANYIDEKGFYPAGRLDYDSEGLMVLTNNGKLQAEIANPSFNKPKTYLVQVEGNVDKQAIHDLQNGLELNDGMTRPAIVKKLSPPKLWQRHPPVRYRKNIPESWLKMTITEGRNRQVRRMCAHVGFPCLRLVRLSIANWHLQDLSVGEYRVLTIK